MVTHGLYAVRQLHALQPAVCRKSTGFDFFQFFPFKCHFCKSRVIRKSILPDLHHICRDLQFFHTATAIECICTNLGKASRKSKCLYAAASFKGMLRELRHSFRHFDSRQLRTSFKDMSIKGRIGRITNTLCPCRWAVDLFQSITVIKSTVADLFQCGRQGDLCEALASTECKRLNLHSRFREGDIFQCTTVLKSRKLHFFHTLRDRYRLDRRTALKCILANLFQSRWKNDFLQFTASLKGIHRKFLDSFRHGDTCQVRTPFKDMSIIGRVRRITGTLRPAHRVCHGCDTCTVIKSSVTNRCYTVRDLYGRQGSTATECIGIDLFQTVWQHHLGKSNAALKRFNPNALQR